MRRLGLLGTTVAAIAAVLALTVAQVHAGGQDALTVSKTVEGPGPDGPYAIQVFCTNNIIANPDTFELDDGETQVVNLSGSTTVCTVTETGTRGADVAYECTNAAGTADCLDDQSVDIGGELGTVDVNITNVFLEPEPRPAAADVVRAEPAFTG